MAHVGIDLGTTFSLIGQVNAQGVPSLFPDYYDANQFRTPSIAYLGEDSLLVGGIAEDLLADDPGLPVIRFVKLAMGDDDVVYEDARGRNWRPEAISALYLRKLLRDMEAFIQEQAETAVIAVPANFNDVQRRATKLAARLAGLNNVTLIEEPTAAATYYGGAEAGADQTLFIYDLGGGTFDATVLQASPDGLFALSTEGCNDVGGKSIDEMIAKHIAGDFQTVHGVDPLADPVSASHLLRFAESAKIKLSKPNIGQVRETLLLSGRAHEVVLTRSQFEHVIGPLIDKTLEVASRCLEGAGLDWGAMDKLLLAGGSTMMPLVREKLRIASGLAADRMIIKQPHQAVAYGAALIAAKLAGENTGGPALHRQIASNDLGLRVWDKQRNRADIEVLIKQNTPLPARHSRTFYTTRPDQTRVIVELVQRLNQDDEGESLGLMAFGPIENPRKNYPVEVDIRCDLEGLVHVSARDPETGQSLQQTMGDDIGGDLSWFDEQAKLVETAVFNE